MCSDFAFLKSQMTTMPSLIRLIRNNSQTEREKISEMAVPVHYHSSFSQAHEFLLGSQVSLIEAVVFPVANKQNPTSVYRYQAVQNRTFYII